MKRKGGFEAFTMDDYEITREGQVYNKKWNRYVKLQKHRKGYVCVNICGGSKLVHRLVAEKYIPNPENKPQVNHKDGDKTNNCVENLEWVSNQENRNHAVKNGLHVHGECSYAKLSSNDVYFIMQHTEYNSKQLAKMFNVSSSHVREIRRYESRKNG